MFCHKILIRLMPIVLLLIVGIATPLTVMSQMTNTAGVFATTVRAKNGERPIPSSSAVDCADDLRIAQERLAKTLATLESSDAQILARDAEIVNKDIIIAKQEARFIEIIQILKEYAALDNKTKKGFWGKVKDKLVKYVDVLTDPATIREVLLVIAVIKAGK